MADLNYINVSSLNLSVPDISNDTVINGTCPWGNDTQYDPDPTLDMVYGVGFGVLFVICTIGNIINIAVLSAMKSSQSSAVYLLAMAIADIVTVWLYFWQFLFTVRPDIFVSTNGFDWFNDNIQGAYVWLQQVFMAFSYWVLAAFSSERVIAVINPLKFRTTRRTTQILVSCIFIYCCISNICRLVTQYWMWANLDIDTFDKESASMFSSTWPSWLTTWNSVQVVYTNVEVFIVCTILIASTTIILTSIVRHQKTLGIRATTNSAVSDKKNKKDFGRTILIVTSIVFVLSQLPSTINDTLKLLSNYPYCYLEYPLYFKLWRPFQAMILIPNSVNFYLNFAFSKKFRQEFVDLLQWVNMKTVKKRSKFLETHGTKQRAALRMSDRNASRISTISTVTMDVEMETPKIAKKSTTNNVVQPLLKKNVEFNRAPAYTNPTIIEDDEGSVMEIKLDEEPETETVFSEDRVESVDILDSGNATLASTPSGTNFTVGDDVQDLGSETMSSEEDLSDEMQDNVDELLRPSTGRRFTWWYGNERPLRDSERRRASHSH